MSKQQISSAFEKFQIIRLHVEQGIALPKIAKKHNIPYSTLKRWVKNYKEKGLQGLERQNRSDKDKRQNINQELEQLIEALILKKPPISLAAVHRKSIELAKQLKVNEPSYKVVWLIAQQLDPALTLLAHQGSKAYAQAFELLHRHEAFAPNEVWQADHTPLDIALINEQGNAQKPWLSNDKKTTPPSGRSLLSSFSL